MVCIARLQVNGMCRHGDSIVDGGGRMGIKGERAISAETHAAGRSHGDEHERRSEIRKRDSDRRYRMMHRRVELY